MQNKPNFLNNPMTINPFMTIYYDNFHLLERRKNKPNSNPIKPNFRKANMNITLFKSKGYRNEPPLRPMAKQTRTNPISSPTNFTQITRFTVVSVNLMHPAQEVELIKGRNFSGNVFYSL